MTFLISVLAFLATIGLLVAVHEYGHFWVARKLGVKVLRYSIGFGKTIWTYTSPKDPDKTEYALSMLPLGGYVKMLDEREGEVDEAEKHRAFNTQPVWKRFLIVLAGPMFNFAFAIVAYALMFMIGQSSIKPFVGEVLDNTPAAVAGFQHQDKIVAIDGDEVRDVSEMRIKFLEAYINKPQAINVDVVTASGAQATRHMNLEQAALLSEETGQFEKIGLTPWLPSLPLVGQVVEGGAADKAGFKPGDLLLKGDNQAFKDIQAFIRYVSARPNTPIDFQIERNEKTMNLTATPVAVEENGETKGRIGIAVGGYADQSLRDKVHVYVQYSPIDALIKGVDKTWQMSVMTLKVMGRLVTGEASIKNISGPVTIANYAGKSVIIGLSVFLGFLAIVSVSLGVLNLLPIPMLDGGHLLYYIVEIIKGSPVSDTIQEMGMKVGLAIVGCVMVLAFYNDIMRLI